jgi:hypothetical protein
MLQCMLPSMLHSQCLASWCAILRGRPLGGAQAIKGLDSRRGVLSVLSVLTALIVATITGTRVCNSRDSLHMLLARCTCITQRLRCMQCALHSVGQPQQPDGMIGVHMMQCFLGSLCVLLCSTGIVPQGCRRAGMASLVRSVVTVMFK